MAKAKVTLVVPELGIEETGTVDDNGVGYFDVDGLKGSTYAFSVKAIDPKQKLEFENKGYQKKLKEGEVIATVAECGYPYKLRMHLDADRDGTIDEEPTDHTEWKFGKDGFGAVIMPRTRDYKDSEDVAERCELCFKWTGRPVETWMDCVCTLKVDPPDRVKVYAARSGSEPLDASEQIDLLAENLTGEDNHIRVWIEAVDFPASKDDAKALVKLQFDFTPPRGGASWKQQAVLRIAPWIMSSDLDPTAVVFVRGVKDLGSKPDSKKAASEYKIYAREFLFNELTAALETKVGKATFKRYRVDKEHAKGFMRDVIKCGYATAPHANRVVILKDLDPNSHLQGVQSVAQKDYPYTGLIRRPTDLSNDDVTGQDNGGNYLVTPPRKGYSYGRIIYGDDGSGKCHAGPFFDAQRIQGPLAIDSTWLDVGHVDEFLSFVPDYSEGAKEAKPFKVLIASPRLAYLLLRATARQLHYPRFEDARLEVALIHATGECSQMIGRSEKFDEIEQRLRLDTRFAAMKSSLSSRDPDVPTLLNYSEAYVASPPPPDSSDGKVVYWTNGTHLGRAWKRLWPEAKKTTSLRLTKDNGVKKEREYDVPAESIIELRKDVELYLKVTRDAWAYLFDTIQVKIDKARETLKKELELEDDDFIEVPTLMQLSDDKKVFFECPDSVNLLALNNPTDSACTCVIPKPFGPVLDGEFVFEYYLKEKLTALGLTICFLNDFPFSINHGEIHCGTNQLPPALASPRWWENPLPK